MTSALETVQVRRVADKIKASIGDLVARPLFEPTWPSRLTISDEISSAVRRARLVAATHKMSETAAIHEAVNQVAKYWLDTARLAYVGKSKVSYGIDWKSLPGRSASCLLTFSDLEGHTSTRVTRKFSSRRKARVHAKYQIRHSVYVDLEVSAIKPLEQIQLNVVVDKKENENESDLIPR